MIALDALLTNLNFVIKAVELKHPTVEGTVDWGLFLLLLSGGRLSYGFVRIGRTFPCFVLSWLLVDLVIEEVGHGSLGWDLRSCRGRSHHHLLLFHKFLGYLICLLKDSVAVLIYGSIKSHHVRLSEASLKEDVVDSSRLSRVRNSLGLFLLINVLFYVIINSPLLVEAIF